MCFFLPEPTWFPAQKHGLVQLCLNDLVPAGLHSNCPMKKNCFYWAGFSPEDCCWRMNCDLAKNCCYPRKYFDLQMSCFWMNDLRLNCLKKNYLGSQNSCFVEVLRYCLIY